MKILSIGKKIEKNKIEIINIALSEINQIVSLEGYDYLLISGGDGAIRRIIKTLHHKSITVPPLILNPIGSFNVIAKLHRVPHYSKTLNKLIKKEKLKYSKQKYYALNKEEIFLFSAGNMGDLQHIFFSETLRFGIFKNGISKYILAGLLLFPIHLIITPFMLLSSRKFFIFTPVSFINKFGSFYGKVDNVISIDLENTYNFIELDGDIINIQDNKLKIIFLDSLYICTDY